MASIDSAIRRTHEHQVRPPGGNFDRRDDRAVEDGRSGLPAPAVVLRTPQPDRPDPDGLRSSAPAGPDLHDGDGARLFLRLFDIRPGERFAAPSRKLSSVSPGLAAVVAVNI